MSSSSDEYTPIKRDPTLNEQAIDTYVKRGVATIFGLWVLGVVLVGGFWCSVGYILWHFLAKYW